MCFDNFSREMPESGSKFLVGRGVKGAFEQSREVCAECTGLDLELPLGKFPSVVQAFVFSPKTQSRSLQCLAQCLRQRMSCYLHMFGDRFLMSSSKFKTPSTPQQMNKCLFGFPCSFFFFFCQNSVKHLLQLSRKCSLHLSHLNPQLPKPASLREGLRSIQLTKWIVFTFTFINS